MPSLETRIAELETKILIGGDEAPMFVRFIGVNGVKPIERIKRGGCEWLAQAGDTDETFMERVRREDDSPVNAGCMKVYFCR